MKTIFSKSIGGDGASLTLGDDGDNIVVGMSFPKSKLVGPIDDALDKVTAMAESALGSSPWVKAVLDPLDVAAKAELASLIGN